MFILYISVLLNTSASALLAEALAFVCRFSGMVCFFVHHMQSFLNRRDYAFVSEHVCLYCYSAIVSEHLCLCCYSAIVSEHLCLCCYSAIVSEHLCLYCYSAIVSEHLCLCCYYAIVSQRLCLCCYSAIVSEHLCLSCYSAIVSEHLCFCCYTAIVSDGKYFLLSLLNTSVYSVLSLSTFDGYPPLNCTALCTITLIYNS